jgi:UDP-N-acetylmuramoyl-tripeptide--D-alanyl-D-alanine ligase
LTEMIRFLGSVQGVSRKIVVAGEMLELGEESASLHRACGVEAAQAGAGLVIGVQGRAREIVEGARSSGLSESLLKFVSDADEAGKLLAKTLKQGDLVLLKGSRGVKLEQALNSLRAKFEVQET